MKEIEIKIKGTHYSSIDELNESDRNLLEAANRATKDAYAPYSNFHVGAAILLDNDEVIIGSNQENQAYPSGLCAERVAIFYANSKHPQIAIKTIAISSAIDGKINTKEICPCGACRQVLLESEKRQNQPIRLILGGTESIIIINNVSCMLPFVFDLKSY